MRRTDTYLSPEMEKLQFLTGNFTGKGKIYRPGQEPVNWEPIDDGYFILDGAFLLTESATNYSDIGNLDTLYLISYDPAGKTYRFWGFTSLSPKPMEATGNFDGDRLVFVSEPHETPGLGTNISRVTLEPRADEIHFLIELKVNNDFQKFLEAIYIRRQ